MYLIFAVLVGLLILAALVILFAAGRAIAGRSSTERALVGAAGSRGWWVHADQVPPYGLLGSAKGHARAAGRFERLERRLLGRRADEGDAAVPRGVAPTGRTGRTRSMGQGLARASAPVGVVLRRGGARTVVVVRRDGARAATAARRAGAAGLTVVRRDGGRLVAVARQQGGQAARATSAVVGGWWQVTRDERAPRLRRRAIEATAVIVATAAGTRAEGDHASGTPGGGSQVLDLTGERGRAGEDTHVLDLTGKNARAAHDPHALDLSAARRGGSD